MPDQNVPGSLPPQPMGAPPLPHAKKQTVDAVIFEKVAKDVNTVGANLRILEERYSLMRNKSQVTEGSMIDLQKNLSKDLKSVNEDITELKHELKDIIDKLRLIDAEMKNLTKREDFKVVERYLEMWQPMEFVTRGELDRLIADSKRQPAKKQ